MQPIHVALALLSTVAALGSPMHAVAQCVFPVAGTTPLIDLGAGMYMGYEGGLYEGGHNRPPAAHEAEALRRAAAIAPIDGAIVMISIGMSNTRDQFTRFVPLATDHPDRNPDLVVVNGAQGGRDIRMWTMTRSDGSRATAWDDLDDNLARAGVRPDQVRVVWIKHAARAPSEGFPGHALFLQDRHEVLVRQVLENYPNVELVYLSSRTRACTDGSDGNLTNPEPYAYESGFGVRWTIDAQIDGDTMLNFDASRGPVVAPLLLWGPYLWAEATPRSDGFAWPCSNTREDGDCTHPSEAGRDAIASLLLQFFTTDPTATPWFLRDGAPVADAGSGTLDAGLSRDGGASRDGGGDDARVSTDADAHADGSRAAPPDGGTSRASMDGCATAGVPPTTPLGSAPLLLWLALKRRARRRAMHERNGPSAQS